MGNVKRVYVEKKPEYAVQAKDLYHELHGYLGIKDLKNVRVLIRYDVENITDETFERPATASFQSRRWILFIKKNSRWLREAVCSR